MPDLDPPPEERLPDQARARMRAGLGHEERPSRAWLLPTLVAAAMVLVVSLGAWLLNRPGGDPQAVLPAGTTRGTPAVPVIVPTVTPPTPANKPTSVDDCMNLTKQPGDTVKLHQKVSTCLLSVQSQPQSCEDVMPISGAAVVATRGTTSLYDNGARWVICDTFASEDGGVPTLLAVHLEGSPYAPNDRTLGVSMNFVDAGSQYFAAGKAFDGVSSISYEFPDGHTEDAVIADGMWSMDYLPTTGPLAKGNINGLAPIKVRVDGAVVATLSWATGTCGQTNHGC